MLEGSDCFAPAPDSRCFTGRYRGAPFEVRAHHRGQQAYLVVAQAGASKACVLEHEGHFPSFAHALKLGFDAVLEKLEEGRLALGGS